MPFYAIPVAERLARRLQPDPATGCVNWTGADDGQGYGRLSNEKRGRRVLAHRLAYELARGPIPPGLVIDHLCRNRRCCNPDHLEAVTNAENLLRGEPPHAVNARKTHCKRGHEFTPENTYRTSKPGGRACRTCAIASAAAHKRSKRRAA